jgi:hypothetical protein
VTLRVEQLESRSLMSAAVVDPDVIGMPELKEWGVPIMVMFADVTGPELVEFSPGVFSRVSIGDLIVFGATGAGCRVAGFDGGRPDEVRVPDPITGGTMLVKRDYGKPLFNTFVFGDLDFRGGLVGEATAGPDGDTLWFAWGADPDGLMPGPQLARVRYADGQLSVTETLAMEEEYRGGLDLHRMHIGPPEFENPGGDDLLVLPATGGGGGPRVQGYEGATGRKAFDFLAGPADLRNIGDTQFRLSPTLAGVLSPLSSDLANGPYGFALDHGDGEHWPEVRFWSEGGTYIARLDLEADPFVGWVPATDAA